MSGHRCFLGYTPALDQGERFYVMIMQELTIYGHTIDAATKRDYPEDYKYTLEGRRQGMEFACYHSDACADGEIGSNPSSALREITREQFIQAWDEGWPALLDDPITLPGPVASVFTVDEEGRPQKVWDSIHGDLGT